MSSGDDGRRFWVRWRSDAGPGQPGPAQLATLRRALGREAGSVPELWRWYTQLDAEGLLTKRLQAEHATLGLFGVLQQGMARPMHQPGVGLGAALHRLRASGRYSDAALDRRVTAAATSNDLPELMHHLRGLTAMLGSLKGPPQPLDFTQLERDLFAWQIPKRQAGVRRRWGAAYFYRTDSTTDSSSGKDS